MGLGKTITCVSLLSATLDSAREFASLGLLHLSARPDPGNGEPQLTAAQFTGSVWGMPDASEATATAKAKAKAAKLQEKLDAEYARLSRIRTRSRATLIVCPLSTVANWEDQFREHWAGEVTIIGGAGGVCTSQSQSSQQSAMSVDVKPDSFAPPARTRKGRPLRVYVYHGNARRPEPEFLADFDAVITTYATLATEFSKQNRSAVSAEADDEEGDGSSDDGGVDVDEKGNQVLRLPKPKKPLKRKKSGILGNGACESSSPLQGVYWFRVVLDEAQ
jgi:SWI/SNF-related matrix-associated actin-dependent regulator of chromatin subfamily A3